MKTELTKQNTLIAVAMEEEFGRELANDWRVVYTGIDRSSAASFTGDGDKFFPRPRFLSGCVTTAITS